MKESGVKTESPIISTKDNQLIQIKLLKDILEGIPVTVDTSLLATSALQVTGNATLASILAALGAAITVTATNLDIRDLLFASDKVDVSGSTGVGVTGPLTDTQLRATPVPVSGTVTVDTSLLATAAKQDTGNTSLSSIDTKLTAPVSTQLVAGLAIVSTVNSSLTPLGVSGVFTGTAELTDAYSTITIFLYSDQDSAANGLSLQFSPDGTNWDFTSTTSVVGTDGIALVISPIGRYFRVVYTNGTTPQGVFRLQTKYHSVALTPVTLPISTLLTVDIPSIVTHSIIGGRTTAGGGSYVDVKVTPSGAVNVAGTATIDGEVSVTDLDTLATEATLEELLIAQGDDGTDVSGPLIQGLVNDSPQSYENNQVRPVSLTSEGRLRVSNVDSYFDKIWQGTFGNPWNQVEFNTVADSDLSYAGEINHV